jgi:hypothetical protein
MGFGNKMTGAGGGSGLGYYEDEDKKLKEQYSSASPYNKPKIAKQIRKNQASMRITKQANSSTKENTSGGDSGGADTASKILNYSELAGSALGLGENKTSTSDQVASNTFKYASMGGSIGGAPGMVVGAVIGGTLGAIKARQARKAARYEAEADKQEAFAKIEGEKGDRIQRAMAGLGQAFSRNLSRRLQVRL